MSAGRAATAQGVAVRLAAGVDALRHLFTWPAVADALAVLVLAWLVLG